MFSLIITIISIALVAILALATLYYGGKAFLQGRADAVASTVINQGQQLSGAYSLYGSDNNGDTPMFDALLDSKYLKAIPQLGNTAWRPLVDGKGVLWLPEAISADACQSINMKLNKVNGIPAKPVDGWVRQCYGENDKFYVLWDAPGASNLTTIVAEAVTTTTDSKGTTVPSGLVVAPLPAVSGGPSTGNNWTVEPTLTTPPPPPPVASAPLFSATFNTISQKFVTSSVSFTGAEYLTNEGGNLTEATLACNDATIPGLGYSIGMNTVTVSGNTVSGNTVTIDLENALINSFSLSSCATGLSASDLILSYDNGTQMSYKYNLTIQDISASAVRPSDPLLAAIYDNVQVNMPIPKMSMLDSINNAGGQNSGYYGFSVALNSFDYNSWAIQEYRTIYYTGCAEDAPISTCTQNTLNTFYPTDEGGMLSGRVYIPVFNHHFADMAQYGATTVNKSGFVKLTVVNKNTGVSKVLIKPFTFNTVETPAPMGW